MSQQQSQNGSNSLSGLQIAPEPKTRVVSRVEQADSSPTKTSFVIQPPQHTQRPAPQAQLSSLSLVASTSTGKSGEDAVSDETRVESIQAVPRSKRGIQEPAGELRLEGISTISNGQLNSIQGSNETTNAPSVASVSAAASSTNGTAVQMSLSSNNTLNGSLSTINNNPGNNNKINANVNTSINTTNTTTNTNTITNIPPAVPQTVAMNNSSNNGSSSTLNSPAIQNEQKLKKATNPSIASLRGITEMSTASNGTLSKGSSRAEFFAAKLHHAIKDDDKNKMDEETFVYDNTTTGAVSASVQAQPDLNAALAGGITASTSITGANQSIMEPELDFGTGPSTNGGKYMMKDDAKSTIADSQSILGSELQTFSQGSPYYSKYQMMDDNFDLISKSSTNSRPHYRKLSKDSGMTGLDDTLQLKDDSNTINTEQNQLRQITSRIFDSKGVQPRRYSGTEDRPLGESFDDDFDYYETKILNQPLLQQHNQQQQQQQQQARQQQGQQLPHHKSSQLLDGAAPGMYSIDEDDSDCDDPLSNYLGMKSNNKNNSPYGQNNYNNHHHNHNFNHHNPHLFHGNGGSRNTNSGQLSNFTQFHDYGSISIQDPPLNGTKSKKKRNDIYLSPHDFTSLRTQRIKQVKSFCYTVTVVVSLVFIGFILGFILATNKELQQVEVIDVSNVLVSQEELIFDMIFDAFNPGLMPIRIQNVQLDIFAKTAYVSDGGEEEHGDVSLADLDQDGKKKFDTVLLGSIEKLELPLAFTGGFLTRQHDVSITEMKVLNPCQFDDDDDDDDDDGGDGGLINILEPNSKWLNISKNPFDLIVRGAMLYNLPFSNSNHTISVSYSTPIKP